MFKKIFKKEKFPTTLFLVASLSSLFLVIIVFYVVYIFFMDNHPAYSYSDTTSTDTRYFLKDNLNKSDDYITKNPSLKDILAGPIISKDDPSMGNDNSDIIITEYSDFECKFCQNQEKVLKMAIDKYKLKLVWKDYPEKNVQSKSFQAAVASRCAQKQNKFWEYHDLLFSKQTDLSKDYLLLAAKNLNLNMETFKSCLDNNETKNLILSNIEEANILDITGIPFIYVNDKDIMGEISFDELSEIIKAKAK